MTSLSAFLRDHTEKVVAAWENRVRTLTPAMALPRPLLVNHMPEVLRQIGNALAGGALAVPAGSEHALQRLGTGFDLASVVLEYAALRGALSEVVAASDVPVSAADARVVHALLDEAITRAVVAYGVAERRAIAALDDVSARDMEGTPLSDVLGELLQTLVAEVPVVDAAVVVTHGNGTPRVRAAVGLEGGGTDGSLSPLSDVGPDGLKTRGFAAIASLPLGRKEQGIGMAHVASRQTREFSSGQQMLFRSFAARATDLVTQARLVTRERTFHLTSRALAGADTLEEAVSRLLGELGAVFGWDLGAFWTRPATEPVLRQVHRWSAPDVATPTFDAASAVLALPIGVGLPGMAWASGAFVWSGDLLLERNFPRLGAARQDGLRSGIAFPVLDEHRPVGVFEFYSRQQRDRAEEVVEITEAIARQVPEFLRRVAAQEQERRGAAEKTAILAAALDAIISMDASGLVTDWNPAAERMFGFSAAEALGQSLAALIIPPSLRENHLRGVARFLATDQPRYFDRRLELTGLRRDGSEFPVELVITRVGTRPAVFTGHLRDISDRVRADAERHLLAEASRLLMESFAYEDMLPRVAALAVPVLGDQCTIEVGEAGTREPSAEHRAEALSHHRSRLVVPIVAGAHTAGTLTMVSQQADRYGSRERAIAEELARRIGTVLEHARLYREAQAATRAREQVLAIVSHDLRNPLGAVMAGAGLLLQEPDAAGGDPHVRRAAQAILRAADRMERLIGDLVDVAGLEAGRLTMQFGSGEVTSLVEEVVEMHAAIARDKRLALLTSVDPDAGSTRVALDRQRIVQVLSNLVGNAIKFCRTGDEIEVSVTRHGREVLVRVRDTGPGITADDVPMLFEPYFTGTGTAAAGTGLGLYISRGIVEAHGGRIWAESVPGHGATFTVALPVDQGPV